MYEAVYMAATGLIGQQRRLDVIADNLANVNTMGFKNSRLDFKTAIYTAGVGPTSTPEGNLQKGHGVMTAAISRNFSDGAFQATGNQFDFAIEGNGFFEIRTASGDVNYTRAGNFYLSPDADGNYLLVNSHGQMLDDNGNPAVIQGNMTSIAAEKDGTLKVQLENGEEQVLSLGIYKFPNAGGLSSAGVSNYVPTEASGERIPADNFSLIQGNLEMSNVSTAQEMTLMIRAQRAFSLASRALTTADQMEGIANNIRS
jgi:flagellar basal-body rod protein FlgG